jgi:hypothetical protein
MNSNPKPASNAIGQFKNEVVGEAKQVAKDTAKGMISEPKKILESILGKPTTAKDQNGEASIEDLTGGAQANDPQAIAQKQQQMAQKQMQSNQDAQAKLAMHRQRMQEEIQYHEMRKQEEEQEEQVEKQQEEQEEQSEIVQLQKEQVKSEQLNRQTHGKLGSHEQKGSKF